MEIAETNREFAGEETMNFEEEIKADNKRLNEIYDQILADFSKEMYATEKYNATHGNMYVGGKNYILASQAVKILKEITALTDKDGEGK